MPRSSGVAGYSNGSVIHWFMPRSRSLSTSTGCWKRSARSNAVWPNSKHSATLAGSRQILRTSP